MMQIVLSKSMLIGYYVEAYWVVFMNIELISIAM